MANEPIKDWVIQLQFDDKEVAKGAKRTENRMKKLAGMQAKTDKKKQKVDRIGIRKEVSGKRTEASLKRQNSLLAKQSQLARNIERSRTVASVSGIPRASKATTTTKTRQPKAFGLSENRQLRLAESIDATMRRAARSVGKNTEEFKKLDATAKELKNSIAGIKTEVGLGNLRRGMAGLRETTTAASKAMRKQTSVAQQLKQSVNGLAKSYLSLFAVFEGFRTFFMVGAKFDSLQASLLAASGSALQAGKDFKFIKDLSMEMGISLDVLADGYRQIGSASRAAGLESATINKQFKQMSKLSRSFGLSAADTSLVLLAFQQMISKGVVSSEELRRQLGERLPGAVNHAANALGVTTLELSNMLKKGQVVTKDFLPKFLKQMEDFVDESGAYEASLRTMTAAQQRFSTATQVGIVDAFGAGAKSGVVNFLERMTEIITRLTPMFKIFGAVVGAALHAVTTALDILMPGLSSAYVILGGFIKVFEDAFDLDKASKDVSSLSNIIRLAAGSFLVATGTLQKYWGLFQQWIESLGDSEGLIKSFRETFGDMTTGFSMLFPLKAMRDALRLLKGISTVVKEIVSGLSGMGEGGVSGVAAKVRSAAASVIPGGGLLASGGTMLQRAAQKLFGTKQAPSLPALGSAQQANSTTIANDININIHAPDADATEVFSQAEEQLQNIFSNNPALSSF